MGLFKRCEHKGRNRDRCEDPWWGSYRGHRVSLAKWADQDVPSKADASAVLDSFRNAVRDAMRADLDGKALKARLAAGLRAQQAKAKPLSFKDFSSIYLERCVEMNGLKSGDTITYRMSAMNDHFGDRVLAEIKTADIEDFLNGLRQPAKLGVHHKAERVRQPATINRYRSQLVQMFNWAVMRDYLERTPFNKAGVRQTLVKASREDNKRTRRLSGDEEAKLLKQAAPQLKLLITAALYSGMRRGEMLALTWADLAERPGWIRLRGGTTKSGRTRWVPVLPNVQAVFDFLKADVEGNEKPSNARVFSNEVGEPIACFRTAWEAALSRSGIRDYRWHDLRHEYASRLAESGVPLVQVQELLGHASIVTTERYNTNQAARLQAAVQVLKPFSANGADDQATDQPKGAEVSQSLHTDERTSTDPASNPQIN